MLRVDRVRLTRIRESLDGLRYDAVQQSLRQAAYHVLPWPDFHEFSAKIAHLPPPQRTCFDLLLLGKTLALADTRAHLGGLLVDDLLEVGLLETGEPEAVRTAGYSLISFQARYFAVSTNPFYPTGRDREMPVYIGPDSYTLVHYLPYGRSIGSFLDVGAGSGLHAIMMAPFAQHVVATDLHPEAAQATRFNAALNGLADRIEVLQGDLYGPVEGRRFDVIVGDLPYVPAPHTSRLPMYADGGEDGMRVLRPLLDGLSERLTPAGRALLYVASLGDASGPAMTPFLEGLAQRDGLDVEVLVQDRLTVNDKLVRQVASLGHSQRDNPEVAPEWADLFQRQAAPYIYKMMLYLRRGAPVVRSLTLLAGRGAAPAGGTDGRGREVTLAFAAAEGKTVVEDLAGEFRRHGFPTYVAGYPLELAEEEPHAMGVSMAGGTLYDVLTLVVEQYDGWLRAALLKLLLISRSTGQRMSLQLQGTDATAHLKADDEADLDGALTHLREVIKTMEEKNRHQVSVTDAEWLLGLEKRDAEVPIRAEGDVLS